MSGDERRYVPPDHTTTAEFAAPHSGSGDAVRANETAPDVGGAGPPRTTAPDIPATGPERADDLEACRAAPAAPAARHEDASDGTVQGEAPAEDRADTAGPPAGADPVEPSVDVRAVPREPPPDVRVAGPAAPARPPAADPGEARDQSLRGLLFALGAGVVVIAVTVGALFAFGGDEEQEPAAPKEMRAGGSDPVPTAVPPSNAPGAAAPTGTGAPSGPRTPEPTLQGDGVTYQVVQSGPGYYEGTLVLANRTGRPLTAWQLEFRVPGAEIRNVWGGRLVQNSERVVITNEAGAPAVPPGGVWKVQYGASGTPVVPAGCVVNGRGCGLPAGD